MIMADPIKIRATLQGDTTEIRMLMQHPMETGQRKDDKGQTLPAQFIQSFTVSLNGKPIIDGQLNTSISRNPLFSFKVRGVKGGDKLAVTWADNTGDKRQDEITVA
jgi:sulfur-oxidizing protein SoxZ